MTHDHGRPGTADMRALSAPPGSAGGGAAVAIAAMISRQLSRQEDQMDDLFRQAGAAKRARAAAGSGSPRRPSRAPGPDEPGPAEHAPAEPEPAARPGRVSRPARQLVAAAA